MSDEKQENSDYDLLREEQLEICEDLDAILHREFSPEYLEEISILQDKNRKLKPLMIRTLDAIY